MSRKIGILFVCLGNICRSPTAHGVFRSLLQESGLAEQVRVDSAGTGGWHAGESPDPRTLAAAALRGYDFSDLRARRVRAADFREFGYILAMDRSNLGDLRQMRPQGACTEPGLFLRYGQCAAPLEVPDPYSGGERGFEEVLDLVERGAAGLLARLRRQHPEWSS